MEGVMALTACRECQREVSTEAAACPHCGCPLASATRNDSSIREIRGSDARTRTGFDWGRLGDSSAGDSSERDAGPKCYQCGARANRACTRCGKMCCQKH